MGSLQSKRLYSLVVLAATCNSQNVQAWNAKCRFGFECYEIMFEPSVCGENVPSGIFSGKTNTRGNNSISAVSARHGWIFQNVLFRHCHDPLCCGFRKSKIPEKAQEHVTYSPPFFCCVKNWGMLSANLRNILFFDTSADVEPAHSIGSDTDWCKLKPMRRRWNL